MAAPGNTPAGTGASGTLAPCELVTSAEVTALLGSAPTPTTGTHADTGFQYCAFTTDSGFLEIASLSTPSATAQFASALASFQSAPSYQKVSDHGATIAFSGGPATNGSGAQGLIAAILKGNSLATVKLDGKNYVYNANQAIMLLEDIAGRMP